MSNDYEVKILKENEKKRYFCGRKEKILKRISILSLNIIGKQVKPWWTKRKF